MHSIVLLTLDVYSILSITLVLNIYRMRLLGLPSKPNGHGVECIMRLMLISLSKLGLQRLWRLIYGLLMTANLARPLLGTKNHQQGMNPVSGKNANCSYSYSFLSYSCFLLIINLFFLFLSKMFIPWQLSHGSGYCSTNNTNELCLLVSNASLIKKYTVTNKPYILMNLK